MNTPNLINANSLHIPLADQSVHLAVTSPPYFSLRAYHTGANKAHEIGAEPLHDCLGWATGQNCGVCYVCTLRTWAREVWRVLRNDGTFWLNLGDSYSGSGGAHDKEHANPGISRSAARDGKRYPHSNNKGRGVLPAKNLMGIPWRSALALQADGWILRSDIIWSKPNPMPESVTDRPTRSHEYVFMFSKQGRYFYDADAIRENQTQSTIARAAYGWNGKTDDGSNGARSGSTFRRMAESGELIGTIPDNGKRNSRSVWSIPTSPYSSGDPDVAHFAAFPPALVEPMIKAGTSEKGCCPNCGKGWVRVVEKRRNGSDWNANNRAGGDRLRVGQSASDHMPSDYQRPITLGWSPACHCPPHEPIPCTILDPFAGSGTSLLVARALGRRSIGLDLSYAYLKKCARPRLSLDALDDWREGAIAKSEPDGYHELPLFAVELRK